MSFLTSIKEKYADSKKRDFIRKAEERICISDFDNNLYIAYDGMPLVMIDETWTSKEIVEKLNDARNNYVIVTMRDNNIFDLDETD